MSANARRVAEGFTNAKAASCLSAIYAWRRVQSDCGRFVADMSLALKHLKGLNAQMRQRWGDMALVPRKQEPFRRTELLHIVSFLGAGAMTNWPAPLHLAMLVLVRFCLATGMRP